MESDAGAYLSGQCGRGGSRCVEKGKARRIRKRKKKNRKRNDPGKAQCLNGCGAEVSNGEILVGRGPDQARLTVQARG